jgi:hypothetical protein
MNKAGQFPVSRFIQVVDENPPLALEGETSRAQSIGEHNKARAAL